MSDLSWLNPTPHVIAVYASQPLLPVATQHSLPSGRYSLLGPDFHRLDRASFAWRTHSINDPKHWLDRAQEAPALAEQIGDPEAKRTMLQNADDYERLAQRAKERAAGRWPQSK
jgi:hypothetical protein